MIEPYNFSYLPMLLFFYFYFREFANVVLNTVFHILLSGRRFFHPNAVFYVMNSNLKFHNKLRCVEQNEVATKIRVVSSSNNNIKPRFKCEAKPAAKGFSTMG